jgi:hypothetical protein
MASSQFAPDVFSPRRISLAGIVKLSSKSRFDGKRCVVVKCEVPQAAVTVCQSRSRVRRGCGGRTGNVGRVTMMSAETSNSGFQCMVASFMRVRDRSRYAPLSIVSGCLGVISISGSNAMTKRLPSSRLVKETAS